jgi:hypothetical protein
MRWLSLVFNMESWNRLGDSVIYTYLVNCLILPRQKKPKEVCVLVVCWNVLIASLHRPAPRFSAPSNPDVACCQ